jgi:hypothetical protein
LSFDRFRDHQTGKPSVGAFQLSGTDVPKMGQVDRTASREEDALHNLLARLAEQSQQADFQIQRQLALELVLQPYLDPVTAQFLSPLEEEIQLAEWYLFSDFFPTDGHPSLIEQIRDTITVHIPEEERVWLDPIRHSYMDVLQIMSQDPSGQPGRVELQSLGDAQGFTVPYSAHPPLPQNRVLVTRLIRGPSSTYLPGPPLILSAAIGSQLLAITHDLRRQIEFGTGNFALAEWPEFMKAYGYLLIWSLAKIRGGTLALADAQVTYRNERGELFWYAIAIYEHDAFQAIAAELSGWEHLTSAPPDDSSAPGQPEVRVWTVYTAESDMPEEVVARLILTPTQLFVEADSAARLDSLKHQLASTFGFTLHFRGETVTPPPHPPPQIDLLAEDYAIPEVTVSLEQENSLLRALLEKVYLEWAEQPCPAFKNETPRHYCRNPENKKAVAHLLDQMEQHDLGLRRTGQRAYNYTILRDHLGL